MQPVRHLLAHRRLVIMLCAAALFLRLLIPTGHMIAVDHGRLVVVECPGTVPAPQPARMHGVHGAGHDKPADHDTAEQPCAFAGLSLMGLGTIDPVQLAALLAFLLALGIGRTLLPPPAAPTRLRPPLRGPPIRL